MMATGGGELRITCLAYLLEPENARRGDFSEPDGAIWRRVMGLAGLPQRSPGDYREMNS